MGIHSIAARILLYEMDLSYNNLLIESYWYITRKLLATVCLSLTYVMRPLSHENSSFSRDVLLSPESSLQVSVHIAHCGSFIMGTPFL